jgi:hypothetical protein
MLQDHEIVKAVSRIRQRAERQEEADKLVAAYVDSRKIRGADYLSFFPDFRLPDGLSTPLIVPEGNRVLTVLYFPFSEVTPSGIHKHRRCESVHP